MTPTQRLTVACTCNAIAILILGLSLLAHIT